MTRTERSALVALLIITAALLITASFQLYEAHTELCQRDTVIAEQRATIRDLMGMLPRRAYFTPDSDRTGRE